MTDFNQAHAYIAALTGDGETVCDWRVLSDRDKGAQGFTKRASLRDAWQWLIAHNAQQYGVFMVVSAMDGYGQKMENVAHLRAVYVDHDGADAQQQSERAAAAQPAPWFQVNTSPGKYHTYWCVEPFYERERFTTIQRKLATVFNGDHKVSDATRVMRVPGFVHWKGEPFLSSVGALPGYGAHVPVAALEQALASVVVPEGGSGDRVALGEGDAAPSLDWLQRALDLSDPNDMGRDEWLGFTAAFKQAGWTLCDADALYARWSAWTARYLSNDIGESLKLWKSIDSTELGWKSLVKRTPSLGAALAFGQPAPVPANTATPVPPMPAPPALDCSGEYLTHLECAAYFDGCTFVVKHGAILARDGRMLNASQFNGAYGGKQFIITGDGKKTDEPWKAATRSTLWTVPKVDHLRFLPHMAHGAIVMDDFRRKGVNTYQPAHVTVMEGDPAPFLRHLAMLLPDPNDQRILIEWMAHVVKYPGFKIPWAPVLQSTEGAGKGVFKRIMRHALGGNYVHEPNAKELTSSGSQFNGWLRNKLLIIADEIKVDDKRDLIEVLKPLISEEWIEIQSKGVDQEVEDCFAVWLFFTNYKDAIPINKNGRRYSLFFTALQSAEDKPSGDYYKQLYDWVRGDGAAIVTNYLRNYPIERGAIPMEAPDTSSLAEALSIGRSPIERVIAEAVEDGVPGFRGGWVSSIAAMARVKAQGAVRGNIAPQTLTTVLAHMGYIEIGRAERAWMQEDLNTRATLYARVAGADVRGYGAAQGYE